jgi:hypothetical protein
MEWNGEHPNRWLKPRPDGTPVLVWVCSETGDVQRDTLQAKFERFMPAEWVKQRFARAGVWDFMILEVPNKRYKKLTLKVVFKTYDQSTDTYESASVDQVVCDEEPPRDKYMALKARMLDAKSWGNGYFKSALTPTEGKGWSIEENWTAFELGELPPNIFVIKMSTYDNAHNLGGNDAVREIELEYEEHERPARIHGDPKAKYGYVADKYIDKYFPHGHLILPFKPDWSVMTPYESIDYAYASASSVGFYAVHMNGEVYRYAEVYVRNKSIPEVKALIYHKRKEFGYAKPFIGYIDRTAKNRDSTGFGKIAQYASKERNVWIGPGLIPTEANMHNLRLMVMNGQINQADYDRRAAQMTKRNGFISYPIPLAEANNNRNEGWEVFNEYLQFDSITKRPRFFVVDQCKEFRREARTAKWKPSFVAGASNGKGVEGDDHALDETRYILITKPQFIKHYSGIIRTDLLQEEARRVRKY